MHQLCPNALQQERLGKERRLHYIPIQKKKKMMHMYVTFSAETARKELTVMTKKAQLMIR
jgi:hypothetical protein